MDKDKIIHIDIFSEYPKVDEEYIDRLLKIEIDKNDKKIIVLDDDPTGTQTVHDISVYTDWSFESIKNGFKEGNNLFYVLTNSRSFSVSQTIDAHKVIGKQILKVSDLENRDFIIISRGDSTLRGHYPLETQVLKEEIEKDNKYKFDGEIICPYFKEGKRFTINNIHYVQYNDELIPAALTEFAKDKSFGYKSSNLCEYIEEKSGGEYLSKDIVTISLEDLRSLKIEEITNKLLKVKDFNKIVVNAIDNIDLKVFSLALYRAINLGKRFLFRTAAGFVKEFSGIKDKPLLLKEELTNKDSQMGGIIVIGSHTEKTTKQLEALRDVNGIEFIEFNSDLVLNEELFNEEIQRVINKEEDFLKAGKTVAVFTKRRLLTIKNDTKEEALLRSVKISEAVQSLVGNLSVRPAFVIAKGGITSSDIGTKALGIKKAKVLGQAKPGIPVWQTGEESKFPNIPYIIFPGNVGEDSTLKEIVEIIKL